MHAEYIIFENNYLFKEDLWEASFNMRKIFDRAWFKKQQAQYNLKNDCYLKILK